MVPTEISEEQVGRFKAIKDTFLEKTPLPRRGKWRSMSDDAIWLRVVAQVVVVGNAAPAEYLRNSEIRKQLAFSTLAGANRQRAAKAIGNTLAEIGTRFVSRDRPRKSPKVRALLDNLDFLKRYVDGPRGFVAHLGNKRTTPERVDCISNHLSYIKAKGARDLLTTGLGMATDVIALDSRVMGIVRLIVPELPEQVNAGNYDAIEKFLVTQICRPLNMSAMEFDQVLFQNEPDIKKLLQPVTATRGKRNLVTSRVARCGSGRPLPTRQVTRQRRCSR